MRKGESLREIKQEAQGEKPADTLRIFWNLTREGESKTGKALWSQAMVTNQRGTSIHLRLSPIFPNLLDRPSRMGLIHPRTSWNSWRSGHCCFLMSRGTVLREGPKPCHAQVLSDGVMETGQHSPGWPFRFLPQEAHGSGRRLVPAGQGATVDTVPMWASKSRTTRFEMRTAHST